MGVALDHLNEREKDLREREESFETMKEMRKNLQREIDGMQKQILMLNNELKSKSTLLDKVKKAKPGAPAPKPPGGPNGTPASTQDFKHQSAAVFVELKDEISQKEQQIEQLNDRIIVQDHELKQLRSLKDNLNKLKALEEQLDKKDQTISELKKKVMVQEEAISSWIEAMDDKKRQLKEKQLIIDSLEKDAEQSNAKMAKMKEDLAKVTKENTANADRASSLSKQLAGTESELQAEIKLNEELKDRVKELEAELSSKVNQDEENSKEMEQLKAQIEELTERLSKNESRFAQEMETLRQKSREEVTSVQKDRDAFKIELE